MSTVHPDPPNVQPSGEPVKAELVFGLVYPLGTDVEPVIDVLRVGIREFGYTPDIVHISEYLKNLRLDLAENPKTESERLIKLGNQACREAKRKDFLALAAISQIAQQRKLENSQPVPGFGLAQIVRSFKRPDEVLTFRQVYRPGFYLIGVFSTEQEREEYLRDRKGYKDDYRNLMAIDESEEGDPYGQQLRKTFHLADVFVETRDKSYIGQLSRFLNIVFGEPFGSPSKDEYGMFLAAAAGMRSAQAGRQVGASILSARGDVLSVGCNDVPKAGGGLYWQEDDNDSRDHKRKPDASGRVLDSNFGVRCEIQDDIISRLKPRLDTSQPVPAPADLFSGTKLDDITEFGRAVHAEMEALLSCARSSVSPVGAILYTTTFPCHTCARHLIAAGIRRVVYVEPYPKSRAWDLHDDAISFDLPAANQVTEQVKEGSPVPFVPFVGVAPRRFIDLFSLDLSTGRPKRRKVGGVLANWTRETVTTPRVPMLAASYLDREVMAVQGISEIMRKLEGGDHVDAKESEQPRK